MPRITIKRDESGNVSVIGTKPEDNGFFDWAFGKVMAGVYTEISWVPLKNFWELGDNKSNSSGKPDSSNNKEAYMRKIISILLVAMMVLTMTGCTKRNYETVAEKPKMMTVVDMTIDYIIYKHDYTGVHYFCRDSSYGKSVCIMVNADGTPYTGE